MRVTVNGEPRELQEPCSLADLLGALSLEPRRVAVECNRLLVPRAGFLGTFLKEGDVLEIVTLVGGG